MTDYRTTGVHYINSWLWEQLKGLEYTDYPATSVTRVFSKYYIENGTAEVPLTPIIPSQQVPEFNDISGGAPFIVYNYIMRPSTDLWGYTEQCAYVIYDDNEERLRAIFHRMIDLLRRQDWTAANINSSLTGPGSAFDFKFVNVTSATGPDQFSQEGGRQGALVTISYDFTVEQDKNHLGGLRV